MAYNITPNTVFSQTTPNSGELFRNEFSRIYENFRFLRNEDFDFSGNITIDGSLELETGTSVNEFSVDGTLGGNSDDAVPTEKAVKAYVYTQIAGHDTQHDDRFLQKTAYTPADILAKLKTVDSDSSGLNANTLQGKTYQAIVDYISGQIAGHDTQHDDRFVKNTDYDNSDVLAKIKAVDGSGSGLDADLLDGAHKDTDVNLSGNSDSSVPTEKAVKTYVDTQINAKLLQKIHPVGDTYTQYPGRPAPATLFGGTWSVIDYQEAFFRAEGAGSNAAAFLTSYNTGSAPQLDAMQRIKGSIEMNDDDSPSYRMKYVNPNGVLGSASYTGNPYSSHASPAGTFQGIMTFDNNAGGKYKTSGDGSGNGETRPKNFTIRIWKRDF